MSAAIATTFYALHSPRLQNWSINQEKSIAKDYPFIDLHDETPDQYVARTYLQFLWLPESIMPLEFLVPSLRRVESASSSTHHPLHSLLEPLLLTPRLAANKYHVELPRILADNGGAGELEETMMWYVLGYEKVDHDESNPEQSASEEWKKGWMRKMEQREVRLQILLYMLKLSLPTAPTMPEDMSPKKRKRRKPAEDTKPALSPDEVLESFMDKLSMWQLVQQLDDRLDQGKEDRDWVQLFCEQIVEPQFGTLLPEACELLRSKVFRMSHFSDDPISSRSPSPDPEGSSKPLRASAAPSRAGSIIHAAEPKSSSSRSLSRTRSRSLSVSLAQEERERAASVGVSRKRTLNREISMSRVFKKPRPQETAAVTTVKQVDPKAKSSAPSDGKKLTKDYGVTLVEETPEKPKPMARMKTATRAPPRGQRSNSQAVLPSTLLDAKDGIEDEEIWELPGSPDALLLRPIIEEQDDLDFPLKGRDYNWVLDTPSKKPRCG